MRKSTLTTMMMALALYSTGQTLTEKKGVRLYEHHSSSINGGAAFGAKANGSMSGYDFVKHEHHGSFNPANMGKWPTTELENIDMVEHNGPFGNGGVFGVTSATSSIWGGDIKGNGTTTFFKVPSGSINYDTVKDVKTLETLNPVIGATVINAVTVGDVYISRIRKSDTYVLMKIMKVQGLPQGYKSGDTASMYFEFDYKYGTVVQGGTAIAEVATANAGFSLYPNPAQGSFRIGDISNELNQQQTMVYITNQVGKTVYSQALTGDAIHTLLPAGMYFVTLTDGEHQAQQKLVITQ